MYIDRFRVLSFSSFKKCNPIYPVSSWGSLTLNFLLRPVHLSHKTQRDPCSACLIEQVCRYDTALPLLLVGPTLFHPLLLSVLCHGLSPSWWKTEPWITQEANGRASEDKVRGFSISSVSTNFPWHKVSFGSGKIHCILTNLTEGGFLSVAWQQRHGLEKINDEAVESSELFL